MSNGVSFLGQSQAQSGRLLSLQKTMTDLQRQSTTQKKFETMSGFGAASKSVMRYRTDISNLTTYTNNIDLASNRIKIMNTAMDSARKAGEDLIGAIATQVIGGEVDIEAIKTIAQNSLAFMQTLINTEADGRYLFAGSAVETPPLASRSAVNTEMQSQVTNWLNGTNTTAQLLSNVNGLTDAQIGFDPSMSTAGPVSIRVDQDVEIDYAVVAPDNGFDQLMKALSFAANLEIPDQATDVPDIAQFTEVLLAIENMAREGVKGIISANTNLSGKYAVAEGLKDQQNADKAVLQNLLDNAENADTTEVLIKLQYTQVQLEAAYQVTSSVSQLSLVNFI